MSVTIQTVITCDGCGETLNDANSCHDTAFVQRKNARLEGWINRASKDYCDKCAPTWGGTKLTAKEIK